MEGTRQKSFSYPVRFEDYASYEEWKDEDYREVKVLAKAIHGAVLLMEHLPTGKFRAVKKIPNANVYKRGRSQLENALVEIGASLYLSKHARFPVINVIKTYGAYRDSNHTYLVTEYASGGELFEEVSMLERLEEARARQIAFQLLLGLKSLHDNGICHRDMSLENTLVLEDKSVRIIDLGQAEPLYDANGDEKMLLNAAGKAYYRAPEMYFGSYRGRPVDVFAVGVEIFIMVFGTPPWLQATTGDDRFVFMQTYPNGLEKLLTRWKRQHYATAELKDLLKHMLNSEPLKRPTVDEALGHPWFTCVRSVSAQKIQEVNKSISSLHRDTFRNRNSTSSKVSAAASLNEEWEGMREAMAKIPSKSTIFVSHKTPSRNLFSAPKAPAQQSNVSPSFTRSKNQEHNFYSQPASPRTISENSTRSKKNSERKKFKEKEDSRSASRDFLCSRRRQGQESTCIISSERSPTFFDATKTEDIEKLSPQSRSHALSVLTSRFAALRFCNPQIRSTLPKSSKRHFGTEKKNAEVHSFMNSKSSRVDVGNTF